VVLAVAPVPSLLARYPPAMPTGMPAKFAMLLGNLSSVLADANKTTVVDVCSTWKDYVGGPDQIAECVHARTHTSTHARTHARTYAYPTDYISGAHALNVCACVFYVVATPLLTHAHLLPAHPNCRLRRYGKVTPRGARYMDMATYFSTFRGVPHSAAGMVAPFARLLPELRMAAPAVGLTEMPGHVNASCGGWPQCANVSNPACGCLDYGWNQSAFATFVRAVEAAGVTEIDVSLLYA
jgi:hypothetical protein